MTISNGSADPGATTTVTITSDGVTDLANFDINLTYDPEVVNVTGAVNNPDFGNSMNNLDQASNGFVRLVSFNTASGQTGSSILLSTLTLEAVGTATQTSDLTIMINSLLNSSEGTITATVNNGMFKVGGGVVAIRTIEKESLSLGESTNITVEISSDIDQALSLREIIPAGWNLTRHTDDADAFKSSTNEWIWFNVTPGIHKTAMYRLTSPGNTSIGTYHINGTISSGSGVIAVVKEDNAITLDIITFYRRLGNDSNKVETRDVLKAVDDWKNNIAPVGFERAIITQEVLALIDEWLAS